MLRYLIAGLIAVGAGAFIFMLAVSFSPPAGDPRSLAQGSVSAFEVLPSPDPVPETVFVDDDGTELTLEDFKGKVLLVNLWATWCGPCKTEMPTLDALQEAMGGEEFQVVAINMDRKGPDKARTFLEQQDLEHIAVYNDRTGQFIGDFARRGNFAIRGLPFTILVDRNSKIVGRLLGPAEWDTPEARKLVRHYVEE